MYRAIRDGFAPGTLTFRDFVTLLADEDHLDTNIDWRAPVDFPECQVYANVFGLEDLLGVIDTFKQSIAFAVQDAQKSINHVSNFIPLAHFGTFADMPPFKVAKMKTHMKSRGTRSTHGLLFDALLVQ